MTDSDSNPYRLPFLETLSHIERPGSFVSQGVVAPCFPGLEVAGVGLIGLPLVPQQAQAIIQQCRQAPFGLGEATVVDTDVRRVWELQPSQLQLTNPDWQIVLRQVVTQVGNDLGLGSADIHAELYKLLMYEKDGFFVPHRDTEKLEGMFATLIIVLPAAHEGGELVIQHDHQQKVVSFSENGPFQIRFVAFYADCEHEVKPLLSGYRCCLVYNLALANTQSQPLAPKHDHIVRQLAVDLDAWRKDDHAPVKLAFLLEHHYTEAGLSFANLKNLDRVTAEALLQAARQSHCDAWLALVTLWESGAAEDDGYDYSYSHRYHQDFDPDDCEMIEVCESSLSADHWLTADGNPLALGEIAFREDELISRQALHDLKPTETEFSGPTGNEGATLERWYRRAAVVVWPQDRTFAILSAQGQSHALPLLQSMMDSLAQPHARDPEAQRLACAAFARQIIEHWRLPNRYHRSSSGPDATVSMLKALASIADLPLIDLFIQRILNCELSGGEGPALEQIAQGFGWQPLTEPLSYIANNQAAGLLPVMVALFEYLTRQVAEDPQRLACCERLLPGLVGRITSWTGESDMHSRTGTEAVGLVVAMVKSLQSLDAAGSPVLANGLISQLMAHFTTRSQTYDLRQVLLPAIHTLKPWFENNAHRQSVASALIQPCIKQLAAITAVTLEPPTDWAQAISIACTCEDCRELSRFLHHPTATVHRLRARQDRRQHLQQQIERHGCDLAHVTEHKGSPHTLVCTKTRDSYNKKVRQRAVDEVSLAGLREMV